jgi:hypothetical protein
MKERYFWIFLSVAFRDANDTISSIQGEASVINVYGKFFDRRDIIDHHSETCGIEKSAQIRVNITSFIEFANKDDYDTFNYTNNDTNK